MLRLGAPPNAMREMDINDIFISRLQLLLIMVKAYLNDYPLGSYRLEALTENARHLQLEAEELGRPVRYLPAEIPFALSTGEGKEFFQRVKVLAQMAQALAEGRSGEHFRRQALKKNLNFICDQITFTRQIDDIEFLKSA